MTDEDGLLVVDALFDSLTTLGPQLLPEPAGALDWEVTDDQLVWTFRLDPAARFHDGGLVRAANYVRAFQRIADGTATPRSFQARLLEDVEGWEAAQASGEPLSGVSATPDGRLQIRLRRPNADLPSILAHPSLAPVPASADLAEGWGERPIGNGPFAMREPWAHNQFIRVGPARPDVLVDEVLFRIYAGDSNGEQQYVDFEQGQLHVAEVPADRLDEAVRLFGGVEDGRPAGGVLVGPHASTYHYGFDTTRPPFDRPELRRAASLVMDRDRAAAIVRGAREPAEFLLPEGLVDASDVACGWCRFAPIEARQLLVDAEIDPATVEPVVLLHTTGTTDTAIAELVRDGLVDELGLQVELRGLGLREFIAAVEAGEGHLFRHGWTSDWGVPASFLGPVLHSRSIGDANLMGFADPEFDALLDQAAATARLGDRLALQRQAGERAADLAPIAPLLSYRLHRVVASDVRGFRMDALGRVDLSRVSLEEVG